MVSTPKDTIQIIGAGKVGQGLARALRKAHYFVAIRAARKGLPKRVFQASIVILAVRDRELGPLAEALTQRGLVSSKAICVHVAGALGPEAIVALRPVCLGVAQMHPMIPFASTKFAPSLKGGNLHVSGDPIAVRKARALGKALAMTPRTIPKLDRVAYHAAAGLVANGAAALAAMGEALLLQAGVSKKDARKLLGPLLRGVGDNVEHLGFPDALTGPIRRGDAPGVAKHLALLRDTLESAVPLYCAAGLAQLPLARALGEGTESAFDEIEKVLREGLHHARPLKRA
jgi:predicted short-subunit dehydrogenase-like oxidoreductase (DUF2520 family)